MSLSSFYISIMMPCSLLYCSLSTYTTVSLFLASMYPLCCHVIFSTAPYSFINILASFKTLCVSHCYCVCQEELLQSSLFIDCCKQSHDCFPHKSAHNVLCVHVHITRSMSVSFHSHLLYWVLNLKFAICIIIIIVLSFVLLLHD